MHDIDSSCECVGDKECKTECVCVCGGVPVCLSVCVFTYDADILFTEGPRSFFPHADTVSVCIKLVLLYTHTLVCIDILMMTLVDIMH